MCHNGGWRVAADAARSFSASRAILQNPAFDTVATPTLVSEGRFNDALYGNPDSERRGSESQLPVTASIQIEIRSTVFLVTCLCASSGAVLLAGWFIVASVNRLSALDGLIAQTQAFANQTANRRREGNEWFANLFGLI
jgi:hypothetical protein